jgi:hypothetical protein
LEQKEESRRSTGGFLSNVASKIMNAQACPFSAWQDQLANNPLYMLKSLPDSGAKGDYIGLSEITA